MTHESSHESLDAACGGTPRLLRSQFRRNRPEPHTVRRAFEKIEPSFLRMRKAAEHCFQTRIPTTATLVELLAGEEVYLSRMEILDAQLDSDARPRVNVLLWTGGIVATLIAIARVVIERKLFESASRGIDHQIRALSTARDSLILRVHERTE